MGNGECAANEPPRVVTKPVETEGSFDTLLFRKFAMSDNIDHEKGTH
jgi:hypothetical protein